MINDIMNMYSNISMGPESNQVLYDTSGNNNIHTTNPNGGTFAHNLHPTVIPLFRVKETKNELGQATNVELQVKYITYSSYNYKVSESQWIKVPRGTWF